MECNLCVVNMILVLVILYLTIIILDGIGYFGENQSTGNVHGGFKNQAVGHFMTPNYMGFRNPTGSFKDAQSFS